MPGTSRKPRQSSTPAAAPAHLLGPDLASLLREHLGRLHAAYGHGNRVLHMDQALVAYLLAFFDPTVRSLRSMEVAAGDDVFRAHVGLDRVCRSTLSDALKLFDPKLLLPLVGRLKELAGSGAVARRDPALHTLTMKLLACDGSMFRVAADVAHAIKLTKGDGRTLGQVRLNLVLDADGRLPVDASVSGLDDACEPAAFIPHVVPGALHVADRNFVDFGWRHAVLAGESPDDGVPPDPGEVVLRCRSNAPGFVARCESRLSAEDRAHGVVSDRVGHLSGPNAPEQWLREVVIVDPKTRQTVRLLTSLLDAAALPAHAVGTLYRYRWQVELFFRWLKVHANFEHLISHSPHGLTFGFHVVLIASLVTHVRAGRTRLSKYAYQALAMMARGTADVARVLAALERRERERLLEEQRLARKRAEKANA